MENHVALHEQDQQASLSSTASVLRAARGLIEKEENWTRGALARMPYGSPTREVTSPIACQWCVSGALMRVADHDANLRSAAFEAFERGANLRGMNIPDFNDNSTHAEVMAAFDAAIRWAEVEERPEDQGTSKAT